MTVRLSRPWCCRDAWITSVARPALFVSASTVPAPPRMTTVDPGKVRPCASPTVTDPLVFLVAQARCGKAIRCTPALSRERVSLADPDRKRASMVPRARDRSQMEYGAHLPLIDLGTRPSLRGLKEYTRVAGELDYRYLCANDHLLFSRPWLDGPTSLAAVLEESGSLALATTIALPVIRGPVQLAKTLAAIDILLDGRLIVGAGPGSSAADYAAVGIPFDERRRRFDESLSVLRDLLADGARVSAGSSTRATGSSSSRCQRSGRGRRSGWRAGALAPVSDSLRTAATAGSLPPTTRRRLASARASTSSRTSIGSSGRRRSRSRMPLRPPGSTSRKTRNAPSTCWPTSLPRC